METDFLHELKSATKAKKNIEEDPEKIIRETTYIPKYFDEMSSKKILIMEYINDAVRMTDDEKIKQMGLSIKEVARSVCEVSASQVSKQNFALV
jgi:aarF domain-containing kinase